MGGHRESTGSKLAGAGMRKWVSACTTASQDMGAGWGKAMGKGCGDEGKSRVNQLIISFTLPYVWREII